MNFDWVNWGAVAGFGTIATTLLLVRQNAVSRQGQKMSVPRPKFYQAPSRECVVQLASGAEQWGIAMVYSRWCGPRFAESIVVKPDPAGGSIMGAKPDWRRKMDFGLPAAKVSFFACQGRWPERRFYIRVVNLSVPAIRRDFPFDVFG